MDDSKEFTLNRADALKMIRNAPTGSRFFASARIELPIEGSDNKCFPGFAGIKVSKADALDFIGRVLSETLDARGGRISIRVNRSFSSTLGNRQYFHIE